MSLICLNKNINLKDVLADFDSQIVIGEDVWIGRNVCIRAVDGASIKIEGNSKIYDNTVIWCQGKSDIITKDTTLGAFGNISIFNSQLIIHEGGATYIRCEIAAWNGVINLGSGSTFGSNCQLRCHGSKIEIGDDNLFAENVNVIAGDGHIYYDRSTGKMLTHIDPVITKRHVWVGIGSTLLSGTYIGEGAIVGAASLINKVIPSNVIVAGNPMRQIREDVEWIR